MQTIRGTGIWKSDGIPQISPSSLDLDIEDGDIDSYRSKVTYSLIDKTLAKGMLGLSMSFDMLTEQEAESIMTETWKNPMNLTVKAPILGGALIVAPFRCAKRKVSMIKTENDINSAETMWKCSFTASQKKKVRGQ